MALYSAVLTSEDKAKHSGLGDIKQQIPLPTAKCSLFLLLLGLKHSDRDDIQKRTEPTVSELPEADKKAAGGKSARKGMGKSLLDGCVQEPFCHYKGNISLAPWNTSPGTQRKPAF